MSLNYKHLRYFWMVARTGTIARAAEQLHLTPQSISGQLTEFAETLGVELFRRAGRTLELTEAGTRVLSYADTIFRTGDELIEALHDESVHATRFLVGCADSVSKMVASQVLTPALALDEPVRLVCREGRLATLLGELAVHRLDLIIADRPMPQHLSVRGFSHLLGESVLKIFGAPALRERLKGPFPQCLDKMPMLLPGEDFATRPRVLKWLEEHGVRPRIVGEFDDSAMMKTFGQAGAGLFFAPGVLADYICKQYQVEQFGEAGDVVDQVYAITTERRLSHPATVAISQEARKHLFKA
ncbi:transcriptional activator NhaR [Pseudoduganella sp. SL102]|uniref:Transcriptional activator NhaR n=1 Tax=Pseudoduganella albidiflava TaxID=321983 RepID=A0A411WXD3_9BURK|nr:MULTISPECIES: transcriptional activator NhaR [Pseudoduganella]QBI01252.1 transcriptional activator NhaR [Pseudoduganella albidiflava]WBS00630.1 transcriptional activator NhaR [Pseudoduganella sp. SL102]GGY49381.1 transcriptional activator NhaR [Pseudoduganella albidiflava]